ncbi:MAG: response regulator [Myxococcota bacterium]
MEPRRILLVDDDPDWRAFLCECLRELGYAVEEADGGEAALRLLARERFDVLLLDLYMPMMNGEELLEHLPPGSPPVVFLTSAPAQSVRPLRRGPHYYLPKSAGRAELSLLLSSLEV